MRTADDVIKDWQVAVSGRSRTFPAIPPRDDEIMLAEVLRLRAKLATIADSKLVEALDHWWHMEHEELPRLRARLAAANRLAASVRQVKAHMVEQGIGPDNVEREMFVAEADYTKMKGGE